MAVVCTLGVDIGTSSSKGVLVDGSGSILATATMQSAGSRQARQSISGGSCKIDTASPCIRVTARRRQR